MAGTEGPRIDAAAAADRPGARAPAPAAEFGDHDLAVIGNGAVAALINPAGRVVWFCFPRPDGDPVLHALLGGKDPQSGFLDIALTGQSGVRQRYLPNTAVAETTLSDGEGGSVRVLDFCPCLPRFGRMYRPPMLLRRIEPLAGRPRVTLRLRPGFDYGATPPAISLGSNHIRYAGSRQSLRLTTDMALSYLANEADFTLDRPMHLLLGPDEPVPEALEELVPRFLDETVAYWQNWVRDLSVPFDWQEPVIRAAITLKLCCFEDTGAIMAALTTSLSEAPGSGRTWDYRFCWLRDAYFTVGALNRLAETRTMEHFVRFLLDAVQRDGTAEIAPLYPIAPGITREERIAEALAGFGGDGPVRIGNAAFTQRQNDVYGSIILSASQMFWDERLPLRGDAALYRRLCPFGRTALAHALEPDAGPWEIRGTTEVHSFSAAMCWAAVHRMGLIAARVGEAAEAADWRTKADTLRGQILARVIVAEGGWISGVLDRPMLDASVLLLPELGLLSHGDPRFLATLDLFGERLLRNGFLMRYIEQDDFGEPETAFLICTFWYIDALAGAGRRDQALALFEKILARRNHVGLLSEGIAPGSFALRGNFPQTYSQVGLILSAMRLSRSWEEGLWRA